jgi:hypothetical protein
MFVIVKYTHRSELTSIGIIIIIISIYWFRSYLREIGFGDVDWIHWAQDRDRWRVVVNTVMNLRVPQNAGNFLTS